MGICRAKILAILRRSRAAAGFALVAAYLQAAAIAGSLAMQATQANGLPADLRGVVALYLCHSGDAAASDDESPPTKPSSHCVICQTAQIAGHGVLPVVQADPLPFDLPRVLVIAVPAERLPDPLLPGSGTARGPPSFVRV